MEDQTRYLNQNLEDCKSYTLPPSYTRSNNKYTQNMHIGNAKNCVCVCVCVCVWLWQECVQICLKPGEASTHVSFVCLCVRAANDGSKIYGGGKKATLSPIHSLQTTCIYGLNFDLGETM